MSTSSFVFVVTALQLLYGVRCDLIRRAPVDEVQKSLSDSNDMKEHQLKKVMNNKHQFMSDEVKMADFILISLKSTSVSSSTEMRKGPRESVKLKRGKDLHPYSEKEAFNPVSVADPKVESVPLVKLTPEKSKSFESVKELMAANVANDKDRLLNHKSVVTSDSEAVSEKVSKKTLSQNQLNSTESWFYLLDYGTSDCDGDVVKQSSYLTGACIGSTVYNCDTGIISNHIILHSFWFLTCKFLPFSVLSAGFVNITSYSDQACTVFVQTQNYALLTCTIDTNNYYNGIQQYYENVCGASGAGMVNSVAGNKGLIDS